jgi:hypothetical protein
MFCNKCGLAIPDDSINCPYCGKPAVSDQPEILQTPYFKTPLNTKNNSSYTRGDYYNLNTYLKDVAEHRAMPIAAPLSASISHDNKMAEAADKNDPSSNRPLYIAIIAMISLIVIAMLYLPALSRSLVMHISYNSKKIRTPFGKPHSRRSFSISIGNGRRRTNRLGRTTASNSLAKFITGISKSKWGIFRK